MCCQGLVERLVSQDCPSVIPHPCPSELLLHWRLVVDGRRVVAGGQSTYDCTAYAERAADGGVVGSACLLCRSWPVGAVAKVPGLQQGSDLRPWLLDCRREVDVRVEQPAGPAHPAGNSVRRLGVASVQWKVGTSRASWQWTIRGSAPQPCKCSRCCPWRPWLCATRAKRRDINPPSLLSHGDGGPWGTPPAGPSQRT